MDLVLSLFDFDGSTEFSGPTSFLTSANCSLIKSCSSKEKKTIKRIVIARSRRITARVLWEEEEKGKGLKISAAVPGCENVARRNTKEGEEKQNNGSAMAQRGVRKRVNPAKQQDGETASRVESAPAIFVGNVRP